MSWRQLEDPGNPENRNAGNGGDLVKHTVYLATLDYLLARAPWSSALRVRECHAGRGMYAVPDSDTTRRPLLSCLYNPLDGEAGVLLHDLQRAAQTALGTWPSTTSTFEWYAGSAVVNAWRLGLAAQGQHQLELYEYAPDTRRILRDVFSAPDLRWPRLQVRVAPDCENEREFDGELHIENSVSSWDRQDLVLLDPFAMWRQEHDQLKRDRYRRILDRLIARDQHSPLFTLFWTWGRAFPVADGDLAATSTLVKNGYQELRSVLHDAGRQFIRVTWRWGLQFAMWVSVPAGHLAPLRDVLQERCDQVRAHMQQRECRGRLENPDIEVRVDSRDGSDRDLAS